MRALDRKVELQGLELTIRFAKQHLEAGLTLADFIKTASETLEARRNTEETRRILSEDPLRDAEDFQ
jgi:hypothetical protein